MQFADGETYSLIYPELTIPESAFNTDPTPYSDGRQVAFRLESTIGIPGSGLIDAIPQDSIKAQYAKESRFVELNPAFWDKSAGDFAASAYYHNWQKGEYGDGYDADGNFVPRDTYNGGKALKRFTYAMTRATLQDGAGANAICEIRALAIPNVLIPLSAAARRGDQILNANSFAERGFSFVLPEEEANEDTLCEAVQTVWADRDRYIAAMRAAEENNAVTIITDLLASLS